MCYKGIMNDCRQGILHNFNMVQIYKQAKDVGMASLVQGLWGKIWRMF